MKVIFSHGKESGPWGTKIRRLTEIANGHQLAVESIDYTDTMDPDIRANRLIDKLEDESGDFLLVGSSMGAYVSLVASAAASPKAMFLMAPALYIPGYRQQAYHSNCQRIEIVHGWDDEIIPPDNSIRYARQADCTLHLISGDHALNGVLETVASLFASFIKRNSGADVAAGLGDSNV